MTMGMPAYSFGDRRKYAMSVLANIFGGSMSSRLFQRIREELGMAYSIYSYPSVYTTDGMLCIYAGMSSENAVNVTENILEEMRRMRREMITSEELSNTKEMCIRDRADAVWRLCGAGWRQGGPLPYLQAG